MLLNLGNDGFPIHRPIIAVAINHVKRNCDCALHHDAIMQSPESLGARLARLREAKGMTQGALAKAAGVGQSTIATLEGNARLKQPGSLIDIAHALGVDAYYLKYGVKTIIAGDRQIDQVAHLMMKTAPEGKSVVLDKAREMSREYPAEAKQTA